MKTFKKVAIVSALTLTMITTTAVQSMARTPYEKAAKEYANSIQTLVNQTGNSYEDATESYPDNAVGNPEAPAEYVDTATDLGDNYLNEIFGLTSGFTKNILGR